MAVGVDIACSDVARSDVVEVRFMLLIALMAVERLQLLHLQITLSFHEWLLQLQLHDWHMLIVVQLPDIYTSALKDQETAFTVILLRTSPTPMAIGLIPGFG